MKRPLLVFAGQSNMMGAAVYSAKEQIYYKDSFEYQHKAKRFGAASGTFKAHGFPGGEFAYKDLVAAYGENGSASDMSCLIGYTQNTFFCPSMCNLKSDEDKTVNAFNDYSEATAGMGVCLAPFVVKGLEDAGYACAYAHIAKGSVTIDYFLEGDAAGYFDEKAADFFEDCQVRFRGDDTSERVFIWLQGEGDLCTGYGRYKEYLELLWKKLKRNGFTKFFMIRVDFWESEEIADVMRAQEDFCRENKDVYMLTRVASYLEYDGQNVEGWFKESVPEEFTYCRDSSYGFGNPHINEKGFRVIAKYAVPNMIRVLFEGKEPVPEEERILPLMEAEV